MGDTGSSTPDRTVWGRVALALATALLILAAACSSSATKPPPTEPFNLRIYAALGDSYAAGEGLAPFEADSGPCHCSPSAYPRAIAA